MSSPLGVYLHVPFCLAKCPYCDFYSTAFDPQTADLYVDALLAELRDAGAFTADTVYFGGGTPSLLGAKRLEHLLDALRPHLTETAEITLECNPKSVGFVELRDFYTVGINRLSIGVQSFDDAELTALGRLHNAAEAEQTVLDAERAGFTNLSIDLMLGTDRQTPDAFLRSATRAVQLPITHISAYMLKIEPNTPYAARPLQLPDDEAVAESYLRAVALFENAGFPQYEISNFAKVGFQSRHNLKYWDCADYLGFGASAHAHRNGVRSCHPRDLHAYIRTGGRESVVTDPHADSFAEYAMLRLRLTDGLSLPLARRRYGISPETLLQRAAPYLKPRLLVADDTHIALTPRGFLVSNPLIGALIFPD